jgi:hypothetical protein
MIKLESNTENIKTSAKKNVRHYELKQHKPWFDEFSKLLAQRSRLSCNGYQIQAK